MTKEGLFQVCKAGSMLSTLLLKEKKITGSYEWMHKEHLADLKTHV